MNQRLVQRWPILALLLLPLLPLYRMFSGEVIGPFGQIALMQPWGKPHPGSAWDILQADGVLQFYGWRDLVFEGWRTLDLPFWNPFQLMGTPLLANSQSAAFYPLHILAGILHLPTGMAINLLAWLHLSLAGAGVYKLSRLMGASKEGAVFAGGSVILSPFLLGWLPLASVGTTVAWAPWCFYFAVRLPRISESRLRSVAGLAACVGMMILGGHLQFAFYGILGSIFFGLGSTALSFKEKGAAVGGLLGLVGGLTLGACLAAPQLLPVLEYSKTSHRAGKPSPEGYKGYVGNALAPFELPGLVFPSVMGFPGEPIAEAGPEPMPAFWPAYVRPGAAFAESAWGLGPLLLACFVLAAVRKRKDAILPGAVALIGILMAMGTPLNAVLYFGVPGWSATGSPGRIIYLFIFSMAVVAALGWPSKKGESVNAKAAGAALVGFAVVALAVFSLNSGSLTTWAQGLNIQSIASKQMLAGMPAALISLLLGGGAIYMLATKKPKEALALALGSQAALGTFLWVPFGTPPFEPKPSLQDAAGRWAFVNHNWGFIQNPRASYPPNTATALRLRDVAGYDSLLNRDTVAILHDIDGKDPAPETNGNIMHIKPGFSLEKLSEAGVTKLVVPMGIEPPPGLEPLTGIEGGYQVKGSGRLAGDVQAEFTFDGLFRQVVKVSGAGRLVVKDRNLPGWTAKTSSGPLAISGDRWREVNVPAGAGQVEFTYWPPGLTNGLILLAIGLLGTGLLAAAQHFHPVKTVA